MTTFKEFLEYYQELKRYEEMVNTLPFVKKVSILADTLVICLIDLDEADFILYNIDTKKMYGDGMKSQHVEELAVFLAISI